jgi:hypothetical protein
MISAADRWALIEESWDRPMTVSEQVWPICYDLRFSRDRPLTQSEKVELAVGIKAMAFEIDRLRARLRLVGVALTLLAISAAAVMLR